MVPNLTVFTCLSKIQIPHKSIYLFYLHVHYAWIYVYCVCLETHGARRGLRFPGTGICELLCGAGHQTQAPWKSSRHAEQPVPLFSYQQRGTDTVQRKSLWQQRDLSIWDGLQVWTFISKPANDLAMVYPSVLLAQHVQGPGLNPREG